MTSLNPATAGMPVFPFSALVGQPALRAALMWAAVDPGLGGVLISGPRGTAKTTAARALAELLPEGRLVSLPLGASEERLIGSLDVAAALRDGEVRFAPGLLAEAHQGVLYVDEVNLLPDPLVDHLLDVAASGVNTVERDGISHRHAARFVLVGTMNPEEGELRPQLLDRFGLAVTLENCFDPVQRRRIVEARLAFDADPEGFRARFAAQQAAAVAAIRSARARLGSLDFSEPVHERVSALCIAAGVDGMRADLVMLRAARALAALEGAADIELAHVERVSEPVLSHRRHAAAPSPARPRAAAPQHEAARPAESEATLREQAALSGGTAAVPAGCAGDPSGASVTPAPAPADADVDADAASGAAPGAADDRDWGYLPPTPVRAVDPGTMGRLPTKKA